MATVTQDKYSPYPRVCDVCGQLRSIATMTKLDSVTWVCDKHTGERTRIMLDVLNAHARPPQTWPVKNPKPQDPNYPNALDYDEGAAFAFIDRQIQAQCRYELVESGAGPVTTFGDAVPMMAWAARYLYGLIQQGTRLLLIARAKVLLTSCASFLLSRQYGSATGPSPASTQANSAFYGGVLESGATVFQTDDVAAAGLALLYAYRILGTKTYLVGARAAASYLRNVQAIGSNGTNFTSQDSAGTARLYTGSLASQVSTVAGFFSNSLFYPSALIALELWNELMTTDGDQTIGATAAVTGFATTPSRLMSLSITDLRACWANGIQDATGTLINGLSSTTPREYFNAYPATKANFTTIAGNGMWEFVDGVASIGTQITAQNFSRALSSLYAYEGATTQVTTVLAWLLSFTSNANFETPDIISTSAMARGTSGTFDPAIALTTALTVRDAANSNAAIKINGSSLYDWGAFGVASTLLAATNKTSFMNSRLGALNLTQRFIDGTPKDAILDRIETRGMSGLTYQTAFANELLQGSQPVAFTLNRNKRGSDLEFNDLSIVVPSGELATCNYWRFTSINNNNSTLFPYVDGSYTVAVGEAVTFYNGAGTLIFTHMGATDVGSLPFWLNAGTDTTVPFGYVIVFVRDAMVAAWKQVGPVLPAISANGLQSPLRVVNDGVRAAQFATSFRQSH